ncbi:hypothetical protein D3C83_256240 [compost metagenome]
MHDIVRVQKLHQRIHTRQNRALQEKIVILVKFLLPVQRFALRRQLLWRNV